MAERWRKDVRYPAITVVTSNPDPTDAINAFLWCMAKARELGMMPSTEHVLAEHLFRKDASLVFYSSSGGVTALCMDEDALSDEDTFEMLQFVAERRRKRLHEKREAEALAAQEAEDTAALTALAEAEQDAPAQGIEAGTAETREAGLDA